MGETFKAVANYVGQICHICNKEIIEGEEIRYYGGPYIVHDKCIQEIINEHG